MSLSAVVKVYFSSLVSKDYSFLALKKQQRSQYRGCTISGLFCG